MSDQPCGNPAVHWPHGICPGRTAPARADMPPAPFVQASCARCHTDDVDAGVAQRILFGDVYRPRVCLCDDCNTVVQGPDHIDVTTGNRP